MTDEPVNDDLNVVDEPETEDVLDEQVDLQDLAEPDPAYIQPDVGNDEVQEARDE